jgi:hypothetical protein
MIIENSINWKTKRKTKNKRYSGFQYSGIVFNMTGTKQENAM